MASQNPRLADRIAERQRGAGGHKVTSLGFTIKAPDVPPPATTATAIQEPATANTNAQSLPAAPPSLRHPLPARPRPVEESQPQPAPQTNGGVNGTSGGLHVATLEIAAPRRVSPRIVARKEATPLVGDLRTEPIQQRDEIPHPTSSAELALPLPPSSSSRRRSPRTPTRSPLSSSGQQTETPAANNVPRSSPSPSPMQIDSPTPAPSRHPSARPAIANTTPIPRGKRMRQPSPNKFLSTPETREIEEAQANGILQKEKGKWAASLTRSSSATTNGVGSHVENAIAKKTPDNRSKRRKVVVSSVPRILQEELDAAPAVDEESGPMEADGEEGEEGEEDSVAPTPKARRKEGKRPRPIPLDEEEEEEEAEAEEAERAAMGDSAVFDMSDEEGSVHPESGAEDDQQDEAEEDDEAAVEGVVQKKPRPKEKEQEQDKQVKKTKPKPKPKERPRPRLQSAEAQTDEQQQDDGQERADARQKTSIFVYRPTRDADGEVLPHRAGVNAIDVILDLAVQTVQKVYASKKDLSPTAQNAFDNYQEIMTMKMLKLNDALDNYLTLQTRTKQAQKRIAILQKEVLQLKHDRRGIELQADDVRRNHEIATKDSSTKQALASTFEAASSAIERGRAHQSSSDTPSDAPDAVMEGLDALAAKMADSMAGGGQDGTGLLTGIVEFNEFLEGAAEALRTLNLDEGR